MQTVTKKIIEQGLADRIIRAGQLSRLLDGSDGRRYALVNRALNSGELLQLQRGIYILATPYCHYRCHPFAIAQAFVPGSYISFETALSFHGWIPEKIVTVSSVVPGRKAKQIEHEALGTYRFYSLATNPGYFLELVNRHHIDKQTMLVAKPCRALMDLVCLRKIVWQGMDWLLKGLRIEYDMLRSITREDVSILKQVYKHKRMKSFLASFSRELHID